VRIRKDDLKRVVREEVEKRLSEAYFADDDVIWDAITEEMYNLGTFIHVRDAIVNMSRRLSLSSVHYPVVERAVESVFEMYVERLKEDDEIQSIFFPKAPSIREPRSGI